MGAWILTRHSGYRGGLHPEYATQVEEKPVAPEVMARAVAEGGLAETTYAEALDLVREINDGDVAGTFVRLPVTGTYAVDLFVPTT